MSTVLVTGGTGFIASHCILQLLAAGHAVRATVRAPERQQALEQMLTRAGCVASRMPAVFLTDLCRDDNWKNAVGGCEYVLHIASPCPRGSPARDTELITPAREGTLRVLSAAAELGVKRVVVTSSFSAISYASRPAGWQFTEEDWTVPDRAGITAYTRAKTLAERAAWQFIHSQKGSLELAVINPVRVLGPTLGPQISNSLRSIERLLQGGLPGVPRTHFGVVDVRDLAALHVVAMTHPAARNQRFIGSAGDLTMADLARMLRRLAGPGAARIPTRELPNWLVKVAAVRMRSLRNVVPELGRYCATNSAKAERLLGWRPRSLEETVSATITGLREVGLVELSDVNGHRPSWPALLHAARLTFTRKNAPPNRR
jgi:dihydroflavonol-4-reductase